MPRQEGEQKTTSPVYHMLHVVCLSAFCREDFLIAAKRRSIQGLALLYDAQSVSALAVAESAR